ncbi:MAG TPA: FlgD immunoglobulin-like domain containing protein [Candidatus Latescibacteria bacterium]|nr:FlgD immunoglobulin-like domain containing protein [Candidatus Latescibacterota bacterium]
MHRPTAYGVLAAALILGGAAAALSPSQYWRDYFSPSSTGPDGRPLAAGSLVQVFDPDGVECGRFVVVTPGRYGYLHVYGDDPLTPEDEGAVPGDSLRFMVDGSECVEVPAAVWESGDRLQYRVDLYPGSGFFLYGTVRYAGGIAVAGIAFSVAGENALAQATSGEDGVFATGPFAAGTHRVGVTITGETPFRPAVTAFDAAQVLRSVVSGAPIGAPMAVADVTGDGSLTAQDAAEILQFVVGRRKVFSGGRLVVAVPESLTITGSLGETVPRDLSVQAVGDVTGNWRQTAKPARSDAELVRAGTSDGAAWRLHTGSPVFSVSAVFQGGSVIPEFPSDWLVETVRSADQVLIAAAGARPLAPGSVVVRSASGEARFVKGSVNEEAALRSSGFLTPAQVALSVSPNPFNPRCTIGFGCSEPAHVRLAVYTVTGQFVRELAAGPRDTGNYSVVWDGRDQSGAPMASGVYLVRLDAGSSRKLARVVLSR